MAAAIILAGAMGVVVARNPVHSALMLVMTLFGVAVLFVVQQTNFLAAVQVIVYAGAIVVLFLFVIMFLGVDREENLGKEPLRAQRPLAIGPDRPRPWPGCSCWASASHWTMGAQSIAGTVAGTSPVATSTALGKSVFTTYLFPFEVTSALLVIAVVGAVVLARRPPGVRGVGRGRRPTPSRTGRRCRSGRHRPADDADRRRGGRSGDADRPPDRSASPRRSRHEPSAPAWYLGLGRRSCSPSGPWACSSGATCSSCSCASSSCSTPPT